MSNTVLARQRKDSPAADRSARSKRRRALLAAVAMVLVAIAGGLYLTLVPGHVASRFEHRADRAHARAQRALDSVYRTFDGRTFEVSIGGILGAAERRQPESAGPARRIAAVARDEAFEKRRLARVRDEIRDARAALDAAELDMTEFRAPFLLGGTDALQGAEELANRQRRYLREARAFLAEYEAVVGYAVSALEHYGREVLLFIREEEEMIAAENHGDLWRLANALGRIADAHDREIAAFVARDVPAPARELHEAQLRIDRTHVDGLRAVVGAIRAGDYELVRRALADETDSLERAGHRQWRAFEDFIAQSSISRAIPGPSPLESVDYGELVA